MKPEKESAKIERIEGTNCQQFTKLTLVISAGKLLALTHALSEYGEKSPIAADLLNLINRANP